MKEVRARTPHTETHKIPMSPVFFFAIPRPSRGQKSRLRNRCTIRYHYWRTSYSWNFWHSLCLSVLAKPSPPAKRYRARFFYLLVFLIILFFFGSKWFHSPISIIEGNERFYAFFFGRRYRFQDAAVESWNPLEGHVQVTMKMHLAHLGSARAGSLAANHLAAFPHGFFVSLPLSPFFLFFFFCRRRKTRPASLQTMARREALFYGHVSVIRRKAKNDSFSYFFFACRKFWVTFKAPRTDLNLTSSFPIIAFYTSHKRNPRATRQWTNPFEEIHSFPSSPTRARPNLPDRQIKRWLSRNSIYELGDPDRWLSRRTGDWETKCLVFCVCVSFLFRGSNTLLSETPLTQQEDPALEAPWKTKNNIPEGKKNEKKEEKTLSPVSGRSNSWWLRWWSRRRKSGSDKIAFWCRWLRWRVAEGSQGSRDSERMAAGQENVFGALVRLATAPGQTTVKDRQKPHIREQKKKNSSSNNNNNNNIGTIVRSTLFFCGHQYHQRSEKEETRKTET